MKVINNFWVINDFHYHSVFCTTRKIANRHLGKFPRENCCVPQSTFGKTPTRTLPCSPVDIWRNSHANTAVFPSRNLGKLPRELCCASHSTFGETPTRTLLCSPVNIWGNFHANTSVFSSRHWSKLSRKHYAVLPSWLITNKNSKEVITHKSQRVIVNVDTLAL